ncbi:MAG: hydantoinase/oxoprolinase family protein [Actinobacteria bacterium]|nr:hydantoinase/oxoprolinase family protein [Actinomycetota bacterium]
MSLAADSTGRRFKVTCDVGGTFTDVVVTDDAGATAIGKSLTTPGGLVVGLTAAIEAAAADLDLDAGTVLAGCDLFVYATTQATNAVLVGNTARTALLCTEGFPDVLVRREGGSLRPYDFSASPPPPYVPRRLTFELPERIGAAGEVVVPLDEEAATAIVRGLARRGVEAVAVSLLWSIVNPAHELRVGELIARELPGVPFTLSHQLNPIVREYRRTSCAAIDASLKPIMQAHLREVATGLRELGFAGELLAANSLGGVIPMADLEARPVYAVRSGPSLAPVAGRAYGEAVLGSADVIVCDTGGTSFDVSLVRTGEVVTTRETWLGEPFAGHLTGLSSVDARSVGAGGGSIAWIDSGGLLRVGPQSAGADPGPACYGNGGSEATVTDAAVVLGYLDPDRFLGGRMDLDAEAAERAVGAIAAQTGSDVPATAAAILTIVNEHMVAAIKEITINQGVDPRDSALVAGGGAAGLGIAAIARELGCRSVLLPRTAGALSAFGAQHADIVTEVGRSLLTDSGDFDFAAVNAILAELDADLAATAGTLRDGGLEIAPVQHFVEARYAHQVWELGLPLAGDRFDDEADLERLVADFHAAHERIFAVTDPGQRVEAVHWKGRLIARPRKPGLAGPTPPPPAPPRRRRAHFGDGAVEVEVHEGGSLERGARLAGPLLITEPTTTIVVPPEATLHVTDQGDYLLEVA